MAPTRLGAQSGFPSPSFALPFPPMWYPLRGHNPGAISVFPKDKKVLTSLSDTKTFLCELVLPPLSLLVFFSLPLLCPFRLACCAFSVNAHSVFTRTNRDVQTIFNRVWRLASVGAVFPFFLYYCSRGWHSFPFGSSIYRCPGCLIFHNMHSTVDTIAPLTVFGKCWSSTLWLIFTLAITSYHRERKIRHRQVGPTSSYPSFPRNHPALPISRVRSPRHFFLCVPGYALIGLFIPSPLPGLISSNRVVRFC